MTILGISSQRFDHYSAYDRKFEIQISTNRIYFQSLFGNLRFRSVGSCTVGGSINLKALIEMLSSNT